MQSMRGVALCCAWLRLTSLLERKGQQRGVAVGPEGSEKVDG